MIWNHQHPRKDKQILRKKTKVNFKLYDKLIIIKQCGTDIRPATETNSTE